MIKTDEVINDLLKKKKEIEEQLRDIDFKGYPEVKELNGKKYIYLRFKKYDRLSSKYVGTYTESFYNDLKDICSSVRELNHQLRCVKTKLAKLGINVDDLSSDVLLNIDYIRSNIKTIIYGQAIVEGVSATFLDTQEILEKGSSKNVSFDDTLTILNLKNAWQYVLDEDTIRRKIDFYSLCNIAGYVNDRQISYPDHIRTTDVHIGGCTYKPDLPNKEDVIKNIKLIMGSGYSAVDTSIELLCYLAKAQVFTDGNKRTSLIFANQYLISKGVGYLSVPDNLDKEYKLLLVEYYEGKNNKVKTFLKNKCFFKLKAE